MRYRIFGGVLEAPIVFPGAVDTMEKRPEWSLSFVDSLAPMLDAHLVGDDPDPPCRLKLFRHAHGFRLLHACTGEFDVVDSGRAIECLRASTASDEAVAVDVIGRGLAISMHAAGDLALHASAVAINGGVIAFMASKGTGKSTLASSLLRAGADFVTDDCLRVRFKSNGRPVAEPGVHALRLRDDSYALIADERMVSRRSFDGKNSVDSLPSQLCSHDALPIHALYVVRSIPADEGQADAARIPLKPIQALSALLAHGKLGGLLGGSEAGVQMTRIIQLIETVPVYELTIVRDLQQIAGAVRQVVSWHTGVALGSSDSA